MARYSSMLLVSSGAAILLSALLLEAAASAPGFMRPTCTTPLGLLQCRGGEGTLCIDRCACVRVVGQTPGAVGCMQDT